VLVQQCAERIFNARIDFVIQVAHRCGRLEAEATLEDRYPPEDPLLRGLEKLVAPVDGGAERLLSCGQITRIARQDCQPVR
jgi:hypothetical protein